MNENINGTGQTPKNNDAKGITIVSIGIMTILVAIAGATFAFFQVTATADDIEGNSAYLATPLDLTITHVTASTVGTKKMIPMLDETIQNAISGTGGTGACLDSNGNAICKVFSITVENKTSTNYYLSGELTFTTTPTTTSTTGMPNLKWAKGTSNTAGFPSSTSGPFYSSFNTYISNTASTTQTTTLADTFYITANNTAGDSKTFYVAVWISETGAAQIDSGSFTGTVTFSGYSDSGETLEGVTSTIRS